MVASLLIGCWFLVWEQWKQKFQQSCELLKTEFEDQLLHKCLLPECRCVLTQAVVSVFITSFKNALYNFFFMSQYCLHFIYVSKCTCDKNRKRIWIDIYTNLRRVSISIHVYKGNYMYMYTYACKHTAAKEAIPNCYLFDINSKVTYIQIISVKRHEGF